MFFTKFQHSKIKNKQTNKTNIMSEQFVSGIFKGGVQTLLKKKSGGPWAPTHSQVPCFWKKKKKRKRLWRCWKFWDSPPYMLNFYLRCPSSVPDRIFKMSFLLNNEANNETKYHKETLPGQCRNPLLRMIETVLPTHWSLWSTPNSSFYAVNVMW